MSKTIVALATAQGVAGLAVVRISGSEAFSIADKCFRSKKRISEAHTHTILYGAFIDNDTIIDNVTASVFHSPRSYTGENTVEFGVHGGAIIPMQIISSLIKHGGEHAQPGEFTKLAFVNGKLDLVQAEAVADLIHSISTPSAAISARQIRGLITSRLTTLRNKLIDAATMIELEMDFAEEDILLTNTDKVANLVVEATKICCDLMNSYQSATILRDGFMVAIAGKPNAGKSTLFNSLLNLKRAIVSEIPGTTRDYITELIYLNDIPIKLVDTAGLRSTFDNIESEGIKYSLNILEEANLILLVNDCSEANDCATLHKTIRERFKDKQIIVVQNKIDLCEEMFTDCEENPCEMYYISAKTLDDKLNVLKQRISEIAHNAAMQSNDILLNERQYYKLSDIKQSLNTIRLLLKQNTINEILSIEIRNAGRLLDEFSGKTWNEEVLNNVFSKFCIGK